MAGPRGYHSYRGRSPKWKIVLAVLLVLVILGSVGFMMVQERIVYDETGTPHLMVPEKKKEDPPPEEEPVNITIQQTEKNQRLQAVQLGDDPAAWLAEVEAAGGQNAFAVTVKAPGGQLRYPFAEASAVSGASAAKTAAASAEALPALLEGGRYVIARISCLRDGGVARSNVETMGLKNTGGYIFYDGNNENWLDPSKQATRDYLCALAVECADLGFDEILLTDLTYPTVGKLDKIAYGSDPAYGTQAAYNTEQIANLLAAVKDALGDRDVKLSLELSEAVLGNDGVDETAGIDLWNTLMARLDRVYVPTAEDRVDAMVTDAEEGVLIPELTAVPTTTVYQSYLLLRG